MRAGPYLLTLTATLALGFSGCLNGKAAETLTAPVHDMDHMAPGTWSSDFGNCEEGGFVASNSAAPAPWKTIDVRDEIGPAYLKGVPRSGNWHHGIRCETAMFNGEEVRNFQFGFIGDVIAPPAWDPGGADRHFIVSGLGMDEGPLRDALREAINADVSRTIGSHVTWLYKPVTDVDQAIAEVEYADMDKGTYGGRGPISDYRDVPDRVTRFWWTVPANGETIYHDHHGETGNGTSGGGSKDGFHPVYWDFHTSAGHEWSSPYDKSAWTSHTGTTDHGSGGVDSNWGEMNSIVVYKYGAASLSLGHVITDVTIEKEWTH